MLKEVWNTPAWNIRYMYQIVFWTRSIVSDIGRNNSAKHCWTSSHAALFSTRWREIDICGHYLSGPPKERRLRMVCGNGSRNGSYICVCTRRVAVQNGRGWLTTPSRYTHDAATAAATAPLLHNISFLWKKRTPDRDFFYCIERERERGFLDG